VILLMDDFDIDRNWYVLRTLKEGDIRVIVFLPNKIQIHKSPGLRLFDMLKRKMQEKIPAGVAI
jgi:hypothetical protein